MHWEYVLLTLVCCILQYNPNGESFLNQSITVKYIKLAMFRSTLNVRNTRRIGTELIK
jgi:hypothetical protein